MVTKSGEKTGGRQKGTPNKSTRDAMEIMAQYGVSGIEGLARIASGEGLMCATVDKDGKPTVRKVHPTFAQRQDAYKELAQYEAPKRKAIEGANGGDLVVQLVNYGNDKNPK